MEQMVIHAVLKLIIAVGISFSGMSKTQLLSEDAPFVLTS